jgi:hypothetical protein
VKVASKAFQCVHPLCTQNGLCSLILVQLRKNSLSKRRHFCLRRRRPSVLYMLIDFFPDDDQLQENQAAAMLLEGQPPVSGMNMGIRTFPLKRFETNANSTTSFMTSGPSSRDQREHREVFISCTVFLSIAFLSPDLTFKGSSIEYRREEH